MRSMAIIAFLALLTMPCIAVPDSVMTGPYKISFDLGIPTEFYLVDVSAPKTTESLEGESYTKYEVKLTNDTSTDMVVITVTEYQKDRVFLAPNELSNVLKNNLEQTLNVRDAQSATRMIDGVNGAIATGKNYLTDKGMMPIDTYAIMYSSNPRQSVNLISTYPWDEGTLQLLKTIHVAKAV